MAAYVINPDDVKPTASTREEHRTSNQTIKAGELVYVEGVTGNSFFELASAASGHPQPGVVRGIALNTALQGQQLTAAIGGEIEVSNVLLPSDPLLVLGANIAGTLVPYSDLVATNFLTILGFTLTSNTLRIQILPSGVQLA